MGFIFQNLVKNLIEEQRLWKNWTLNYWRTTDKAEVDFIINKGEEIIPIEVKYSNVGTIKRSLRSLIDKYSPRKAFVITVDLTKVFFINKTKVIFLPYYKLYRTDIFN